MTSPCDGWVIYTSTPGLAKSDSNIAIVVCSETGAKRNIQATKPFMILENILPNPSIVQKRQPLIVVDASKLNWEESSDDYYDTDAVNKVFSPSNTRNSVKNQKCKFKKPVEAPQTECLHVMATLRISAGDL